MPVDPPPNTFDRNIRLFTHDGQDRLRGTTIGVVGCGGVGSVIASELTRLGVGELVLVDPDIVEESNLPRLVGAGPGDVGEPKVKVLHRHINATAPWCTVTGHYEEVEDCIQVANQVDLLVSGVDRLTPRVQCNTAAVRTGTPYVDAGCLIDPDGPTLDGYIQYINPGVTGCFECLDRADPETLHQERLDPAERNEAVQRGYIAEEDLEPEPAVIFLNGVVGSLAVSVVVGHLMDWTPLPTLLHYRQPFELTAMHAAPSEHCPVCGQSDPEHLDLGLDVENTEV